MRFRSALPAMSAGGLALVLVLSPLAGQVRAAKPYTVRAGDTLSAIAARMSTSVSELVALNHLANPDHIIPGQRLALPDQQPAVRPAARTVTHVVRAGEDLTGIAARYGTTIARIVAVNNLPDPNLIFPGQRLRIDGATRGFPGATAKPSPTTANGAAPSTRTYRVRAGDNLTAIAARFHSTIGRLVALNSLANPSYIRTGQLLRVPVVPPPPKASWTIANFGPDTQALMNLRMPVASLIVAEAKRAGVPAPLALAVAWLESGWRQSVVSSAGAVGIMQVLPDTAQWVADAMLDSAIDIRTARDNVRAGVTLLHYYLDRYHGDRRLVLAAYYQGQRATDEHGIFAVSRPYIGSIMLLESQFKP